MKAKKFVELFIASSAISALLQCSLVASAQEAQQSNEVFWSKPEFWQSKAIKTPFRENISNDEKLSGLAQLWSEVKYNFINFHLVPELDWDKAFVDAIPKVLATKSTLDYYLELQRFCALLKDGHTDITTPKELDEMLFGRPLLITALVEDKVVITAIHDTKLKANGLALGQEIEEIDGVLVKKYAAEKLRPYSSDSTTQASDVSIYSRNLLAGQVGKNVNLKIKDKTGRSFTVSLARLPWQERSKIIKRPAPFEMKILPGNVAYVAVNSMQSDGKAHELFAKAYGEIEKSNALVLDLRNNGGGDGSVAFAILSYLTDSAISPSSWYTRNYRPTFRAWKMPQEKFSGNPNEDVISLDEVRKARGQAAAYSKPVIVLSGPRTGSAAEDFLVAFKPLKRGLVVGEPTNGSTGQPLIIDLPGGGSARICTKHDTFADGKEFVGFGVQPDILTRPRISDLLEGTDSVLSMALKQLEK